MTKRFKATKNHVKTPLCYICEKSLHKKGQLARLRGVKSGDIVYLDGNNADKRLVFKLGPLWLLMLINDSTRFWNLDQKIAGHRFFDGWYFRKQGLIRYMTEKEYTTEPMEKSE